MENAESDDDQDGVFAASDRTAGDLGAYFRWAEGDGGGYFHLADIRDDDNISTINAVRVCRGRPEFSDDDLDVVWSADETAVGLFVRGKLYAVFYEDGKAVTKGDYPLPQAELDPNLYGMKPLDS